MNEQQAELIAIDVADCSDRGIVQRVLAGERDAYALLVDRYGPMIHRFLAGRGLRGMDLDEAAQDVFVRVYSRLRDLREPEKVSGYLMTTAARRIVDSKRRRIHELTDPSQMEEISHRSQDQRKGASAESLQAAVARLPDAMQVVLTLKYGDKRSAAEIAEILGQSVNSVTKTLSRAYQRLRCDEQLRRAWRTEEST